MKKIIFLVISLFAVSSAYVSSAYARSVVIFTPDNISGDTELDWISDTFARSIQLEIRKAKMSVKIEKRGAVPEADFVVISSYRRAKDGRRIIFYINLLGKGDFFVGGGDLSSLSLIDSFSFTFIPEVVYEAKTYISKILRLYIEGSIFSDDKFKPLRYKFPADSLERVRKRLADVSVTKADIQKIIFDPSEILSWFELGVLKLKEGDAEAGISFLLRFIEKAVPDFPSEKDALADQRILLARDIFVDLIPGNSAKRTEAVNFFIISQFYGDFSGNEIELLTRAVSMDSFLWPAMRRLGEIHYARGEFKQSIRYMRDYLSTANESYKFVIVFSRVVSLADELARGF